MAQSPSKNSVPGRPAEVLVGSVLPDVLMKGLSGPDRRLGDLRGKPLIINVWASWCGPCREEMGSLDKLAQLRGADQFSVIGISTDDYPDAAQGFLRRARTRFPHFIDARLQLESLLGADRLPLTVLVDAKGRVLSKHYGQEDWTSPRALTLIGLAFRIRLPSQ